MFSIQMLTFQSNCAEGLHIVLFNSTVLLINPRLACAARVTVLGLCVCVCVCSNLPPDTLESQKRDDTNGLIAIREQKKRRFL